jgi:hypothetical protein
VRSVTPSRNSSIGGLGAGLLVAVVVVVVPVVLPVVVLLVVVLLVVLPKPPLSRGAAGAPWPSPPRTRRPTVMAAGWSALSIYRPRS